MYLTLLILAVATFLAPAHGSSTCDVSEVYQEVSLDGDLLVEVMGSIQRPYRVWRPATIRNGSYRVEVRENGEYFIANQGSLLIETGFCMETTIGTEEAILHVRSYGSELEFPDSY